MATTLATIDEVLGGFDLEPRKRVSLLRHEYELASARSATRTRAHHAFAQKRTITPMDHQHIELPMQPETAVMRFLAEVNKDYQYWYTPRHVCC